LHIEDGHFAPSHCLGAVNPGKLAELDAVVVKVLPVRERVRILLEFLGQKIEAELDQGSVFRQKAHPLAA
jgi:hypothetical protein